MKLISIFGILSFCLSSVASQIPETKKLHPELYTIQFTIVDIDLSCPKTNQTFSSCSGSEKTDLMGIIMDNYEVSFTDYASANLSLGSGFISDNELLSGVATVSSNNLATLKFKIDINGQKVSHDAFPIVLNDWSNFAFKQGDKKLLMYIKIYKPER